MTANFEQNVRQLWCKKLVRTKCQRPTEIIRFHNTVQLFLCIQLYIWKTVTNTSKFFYKILLSPYIYFLLARRDFTFYTDSLFITLLLWLVNFRILWCLTANAYPITLRCLSLPRPIYVCSTFTFTEHP